MRFIVSALTVGVLAGCGTMDTLGLGGNVYERQGAAVRAYESGEDAEAEALYLGLIRQAPNDPENLLRLGNLYARSGRPERAAEVYQQALLLNPRDERLWYNLGVIRQRQGHAALIEAHARMLPEDPRRARVEALSACLAPIPEERTASPTATGTGAVTP